MAFKACEPTKSTPQIAVGSSINIGYSLRFKRSTAIHVLLCKLENAACEHLWDTFQKIIINRIIYLIWLHFSSRLQCGIT